MFRAGLISVILRSGGKFTVKSGVVGEKRVGEL
jgi:hypothetical protein